MDDLFILNGGECGGLVVWVQNPNAEVLGSKPADIRLFPRARHLSPPMGKPTICLGENKGADQLRGNREADQRLCFRYSDSTIPLLLKSEISSF